MRKPRPNAYNPAQALFLISNDRSGSPLTALRALDRLSAILTRFLRPPIRT